MIEELIRVIAVHFRNLAQVLDACGKRCPKTDHFVRQLQLSDTGVSGGIVPKCNITPCHFRVAISTCMSQFALAKKQGPVAGEAFVTMD